MDLANKKNIENGSKNAMITKSVEEGVEAEVFSDMPAEAKDFLIKYHNGVSNQKDVMVQLKLVRKVAWYIINYQFNATVLNTRLMD